MNKEQMEALKEAKYDLVTMLKDRHPNVRSVRCMYEDMGAGITTDVTLLGEMDLAVDVGQRRGVTVDAVRAFVVMVASARTNALEGVEVIGHHGEAYIDLDGYGRVVLHHNVTISSYLSYDMEF